MQIAKFAEPVCQEVVRWLITNYPFKIDRPAADVLST